MEELLNDARTLEFSSVLGRTLVKAEISCVLDEIRREVCSGFSPREPLRDIVARRAAARLSALSLPSLKSVVNATGVVVHTNLGRAPLAPQAVGAVLAVAGSYSNLEYSTENGARASRESHVEALIKSATGAQAALVVNNNAAALLLALSSLAAGREVIVSNGELVEIGGSFRIPDILAFSGAKMMAVGCTNSTRLHDWEGAINENTAALLKVHTSNYRLEGFCASARREEISALARERGLVFIEDLGSGLLRPLDVHFCEKEPVVRKCLDAGAGLVTFSGDKLLGGPQLGVIAGKKELVDKARKHQLLRAVRVDKMTLAAFEATLRLYLSERHAEIPVARMIEAKAGELRSKAQRLAGLLRRSAEKHGERDLRFSVVETEDAAGGGAFPALALPGYGVAVQSAARDAESLARGLRMSAESVIPAVRDGQVVLHVRALLPGDEKRIACAFIGIITEKKEGGGKREAKV
jgi:L-seryl-tRNA(Ser) seleniumtransferase